MRFYCMVSICDNLGISFGLHHSLDVFKARRNECQTNKKKFECILSHTNRPELLQNNLKSSCNV